MGISDYLWPFQRSFSEVPCSREAGLGGLAGGPIIGSLTLILTRNPLLAFKYGAYSGLGIFWLIFPYCRYQFYQEKIQAAEVEYKLKTGKIN